MTYRSDDLEPRRLYRSRRGMILGVCRGIANYLNFSVFWTRVIFLGVTLFSAFWPGIGIYLLAAVLMKPEPMIPIETEEDREFYCAYTSSRTMALQRLKRMFDNLDRRIQRMEDRVTTRGYDWDRRFKGE